MSAPGPVRFVSEFQLAAAKGQRISRVRQQALSCFLHAFLLARCLDTLYQSFNVLRILKFLQEVFGRTVTVLLHEGKYFAIDSACFHMGGPIGEAGDIEELAGNACIVCPWHGRKVIHPQDHKTLACSLASFNKLLITRSLLPVTPQY